MSGAPVRLLFVSHSFPPENRPLLNVGGMQRVAMDLHTQLGQESWVELHSLVLRSSWRWIVPRAIPFLGSLLTRLPQAVAQHRVEAVLFSSMTTALPALAVADRIRRQGATVSAICHGLDVTEPNLVYQAAVRRTLSSLDAVFPVSRATGRACIDRGIEAARVKVVPNGIHLERYDKIWREKQSGPRRTPLDLPVDAFLCVSVGRQVKRKGFSWFVREVMPRLPPNVHYWLAGSGPEAEDLRCAARAQGLEGRVRVLGLVDEATLESLYTRADLFVMPNISVPGDMEGFGVVMLEAGACGVPTLAADLEGIADVITPGENGHLVPSENAEAFASRVRQLQADPAALTALSIRSAALVREKFAWPSVVESYRQALEAVTPGR